MHTSTGSILFLASLLAASTTAQEGTSTVQAVTQIADGQPQAPPASTVAPVTQIDDGQPQAPPSSIVAPVSETSPAEVTYSSYVNPYMSETDSLGVVTGQPSAVTTQPAVVTSQASAATYYSNAPGVPEGLNTTLIPAVSSSAKVGTSAAGNLSSSTRTASASRTAGSSGAASGSGTATSSGSSSPDSTGAAASIHVAGTGLALGVAGAFFAMLM